MLTVIFISKSEIVMRIVSAYIYVVVLIQWGFVRSPPSLTSEEHENITSQMRTTKNY